MVDIAEWLNCTPGEVTYAMRNPDNDDILEDDRFIRQKSPIVARPVARPVRVKAEPEEVSLFVRTLFYLYPKRESADLSGFT